MKRLLLTLVTTLHSASSNTGPPPKKTSSNTDPPPKTTTSSGTVTATVSDVRCNGKDEISFNVTTTTVVSVIEALGCTAGTSSKVLGSDDYVKDGNNFSVSFDPYKNCLGNPDPNDASTYSVDLKLLMKEAVTVGGHVVTFQGDRIDLKCTFAKSYQVESDLKTVKLSGDDLVGDEFLLDFSIERTNAAYDQVEDAQIYTNQMIYHRVFPTKLEDFRATEFFGVPYRITLEKKDAQPPLAMELWNSNMTYCGYSAILFKMISLNWKYNREEWRFEYKTFLLDNDMNADYKIIVDLELCNSQSTSLECTAAPKYCMPECTCDHGTKPVNGLVNGNIVCPNNEVYCTSCEPYATFQTDKSCKLNECSCLNGQKPVNGLVNNQRVCTAVNLPYCISCNDYATLQADNTCKENTCTCKNGTTSPTPRLNGNTVCPKENHEYCTSCNLGFKLDTSDDKCQVYDTCTCANGDRPALCDANSPTKCASCKAGYKLDTSDDTCKVFNCTCANGSTHVPCRQDLPLEQCETCTAYATLQADNTCKIKPEYIVTPRNNFIKGHDFPTYGTSSPIRYQYGRIVHNENTAWFMGWALNDRQGSNFALNNQRLHLNVCNGTCTTDTPQYATDRQNTWQNRVGSPVRIDTGEHWSRKDGEPVGRYVEWLKFIWDGVILGDKFIFTDAQYVYEVEADGYEAPYVQGTDVFPKQLLEWREIKEYHPSVNNMAYIKLFVINDILYGVPSFDSVFDVRDQNGDLTGASSGATRFDHMVVLRQPPGSKKFVVSPNVGKGTGTAVISHAGGNAEWIYMRYGPIIIYAPNLDGVIDQNNFSELELPYDSTGIILNAAAMATSNTTVYISVQENNNIYGRPIDGNWSGNWTLVADGTGTFGICQSLSVAKDDSLYCAGKDIYSNSGIDGYLHGLYKSLLPAI